MSRPRKYPDELRECAVRRVFESKRPIAHVAQDLGIHKESLRHWVRQADSGRRRDLLSSEERGVRFVVQPATEPTRVQHLCREPSAGLEPSTPSLPERWSELGIDAGALPVSHLAVRTRTWREYLVLRDELEERSVANLENVWNGRPISKLLLADPCGSPSRRRSSSSS